MADINSDLRRKRKNRKVYFAAGASIFGALLLLAGGWWTLFRSHVLWADTITIQGADEVGQDRIASFLTANLLGSWLNRSLGYNNLLIWPGSIPSQDLAGLPEVQAITIDKSYFGQSVVVHVAERSRAGIWCIHPQNERQCFWFDPTGFIFKDAPQLEGSLIPVVDDYTGRELGIGKEILDQNYLSNFFSILSVLKTANVGTREIRLDDLGLEEVHVQAVAGPELMFSLRFSAANTLAVLKQLAPDLGKLQYVDFRVQNRAYYK